MASRTLRWTFLVVPLIGGPVWWLTASKPKDTALVAPVKVGDFRIVVTSAGELQAPRSVEIQGPSAGGAGVSSSMSTFGGGMVMISSGPVDDSPAGESYEAKISSIVPEGTIVKQGDFVAELDRTAIAQRLQDVSVAFEKARAQVTQVELDTALALTDARDQIRDLELGLEEKKLVKDQALYEAPAIKRQAQIDLDKGERELAKLKMSYGTKQQQAAARVRDAEAEVNRQLAKVNAIKTLMERFTVRAPSAGMVIYRRSSSGRPRGVGTVITPFDPVIATLPDFSVMESVTYINEIDVGKVVAGQPVQISLDGDPSKRLTGRVTSIANIGERRQNSDAKVFRVVTTIDRPDSTLRPGMTTSNVIETTIVRNALSIPIEAVMSKGDTAYVYKRVGHRVVAQQVELGPASENEIVIRRGLARGDQIQLTEPADSHDLPLVRLR